MARLLRGTSHSGLLAGRGEIRTPSATFQKHKLSSKKRATRVVTAAFGENQLGVHALTWAGSWAREDAERAIGGSAAVGYDMIEIAILDPSTCDPAMTKALLQEHGLAASFSLGLRLDADVSSEDSDVAAAGEALLREALAVTAKCGGTHLCGILYSALAKYPGPPTKKGRANAVAAIRRLAAEAEDLGVQLNLEAVNRYETNLINTAQQDVEMIHDIGHSNVKVQLDTYHMHIEEAGLAQAIATAADAGLLGYMHIGESHRGYMGTGNIDFPQVFGALAKADYSGPITFESFSSRVVDPTLSNTLCIWRDFWSDSEDIATQAKQFTEAQMTLAKLVRA